MTERINETEKPVAIRYKLSLTRWDQTRKIKTFKTAEARERAIDLVVRQNKARVGSYTMVFHTWEEEARRA